MKNRHKRLTFGDEEELSRELDRLCKEIDDEDGEVVQVTLLHNIGIVIYKVDECTWLL
jgi:hypothetical protein